MLNFSHPKGTLFEPSFQPKILHTYPNLPTQWHAFYEDYKYDTIHKSGKFETDTIHHTVQNFSFTDQIGKTITEGDFKENFYVVDFFFTTCQSICPIMTTQMKTK